MVAAQDVRRVALGLPRTYEALVRDRVKFKVGRIVYLSISPDETTMGFAHPKEERAALVAAQPDKFLMPVPSDERYNWVQVRLAALDPDELDELVVDAWCMAVPRGVAVAELSRRGLIGPGRGRPTQEEKR
ncbi:MmcQ/YjbR family DNA-binding protein [Micromonospora zamorensis]|uniref:MmcQ/YjbR family DNA-binding protein n=1 Tax=Micromonospora zamorensis TaxID=709883 RepID=UPI003D9946FC